MNSAVAKTVLVISYVFPPAAYVGVHRTLKYCKYLGELGWRPIVITIDPKGVVLQDERLCDDLPPDIEIFRTRDIDPAKWLASRSSRRTPEARHESSRIASEQQMSDDARRRVSVLTKAKRLVRQILLHSPDSHLFWVPFALLRGIRVLLTRRVDVIYSSSPPHSSHLAASLLARCFRKPHVADFRDPWFVKGSKRGADVPPGVLPGVQAWLKRRVITSAFKIVSVSAGERDDLLKELPRLDPRRVEVITNGYDPGDFSNAPAACDVNRFTITHAGTLYRGVGREFFDALVYLATAHGELRERLRVNLMGNADPEYDGVIERLSRLQIVSNLGFQPHRTALACAQTSDVLLVLLGGSLFLPSHVPAKIFEYLFIGKPILAVARPGDATDILRRSGLGIIVSPSDGPALAEAIMNLYSGWQSGQPPVRPDVDYICRFERRRLAGKLAGVLDQATANPKQKAARPASLGAH